MGNAKLNGWMQYVLLVGVILGLILSYNAYNAANNIKIPEAKDIPTAQEIADLIVIGDNQDVLDVLNELEDWEDSAETIATAEWEESDYKDVYKAIDELYGDIDDRDDIDYVREDENTDYAGIDVDDKDAIVTQYIKVKYEDDSGDNSKVYLTIETEIEEGEVEDQEISITE